MEEIVNRVAKSPLVSLDLKEFQVPGDRVEVDLKDFLFQGMILREKDFRAYVKDHDWHVYDQKHVAVHCSEDVIIPNWAYMLVVTQLAQYASSIVQGDLNDLEKSLYVTYFAELDVSEYKDKKVVIKGCSEIPLPAFAFVEITKRLQPMVKSLMYGEPCSTVPVYKKPL